MATKKLDAVDLAGSEISAESTVSKKETIKEEMFKVSEIVGAHKKFGYAPELISVALNGCTELTIKEALSKIEAFAKKGVK
jgi:hypothetical protein